MSRQDNKYYVILIYHTFRSRFPILKLVGRAVGKFINPSLSLSSISTSASCEFASNAVVPLVFSLGLGLDWLISPKYACPDLAADSDGVAVGMVSKYGDGAGAGVVAASIGIA